MRRKTQNFGETLRQSVVSMESSFASGQYPWPHWGAIRDGAMTAKSDLLTSTYIAGAIGFSQFSYLLSAQAGAFANILALGALTALAIRIEKARMLAVSVSILPVVTMASQSFVQPNALIQSATFYFLLLVLALIYSHMFKRPYAQEQKSFVWKGNYSSIPFSVIKGQILGLLAYLLLRNTFPYNDISIAVTLCVMAFAITEEIYFRGLIQKHARTTLSPILSVAITVGVYSFLTIPLGSPAITLFAIISSAVLSLSYNARPNLILTTSTNLTFKLVFICMLAYFK